MLKCVEHNLPLLFEAAVFDVDGVGATLKNLRLPQFVRSRNGHHEDSESKSEKL